MSSPIVSPENLQLKRCSRCGELKPFESYGREKRSPSGLRSECSACQRAYDLSRKDRKSVTCRAWREAHADEIRERKAARRAVNLEEERAKGRAQYHAHKEARNEYSREYRKRNREILREKNREYFRSAPGRASVHRRRARVSGLPYLLTTLEWEHTLAHFGGCCAVCGRPPGLWHIIALDHWIPLDAQDCPGTVFWNVVPLCHATKDGEKGCNNTKTNRRPDEWLISQFGKRKGTAILRSIEAYLESTKVNHSSQEGI
jgi:hypothetical protein